MEDGIIKYRCHWDRSLAIEKFNLDSIIYWRDKAFDLGYIGIYENGIGFGNISRREDDGFLVSGSATGNLIKTTFENYALVNKWDIKKNQLWCSGAVQASSESLTHAIIYDTLPMVNSILHIHNAELWEKYYSILPSTAKEIEYGTPEMALAIQELILKSGSSTGIFLMKGHEEGLISFGSNFDQVFESLEELVIR